MNCTAKKPDFLIPVRKYEQLTGVFEYQNPATLKSEYEEDLVALGQLAGDLEKCGIAASANQGRSVDFSILRDGHIRNSEGYRLRIVPGQITITASTGAGAYYAVQTCRELVRMYGSTIPACLIEDEPDFERRGVLHDCSRGKVPTLETLKSLVEMLAHWKINELQLYVENVFAFSKHPAIGRGYSPFSAEEIISLREHCKKHHLQLVGCFASFGHTEQILYLPEYRHLSEMTGSPYFPWGSTLCPIDPGSIQLISDLYSEFVPLFDALDFNACCDETHELGKGRSSETAQKIGVGRVYLEYIKKIHQLCSRYDKRLNIWTDIVMQHPELLCDVPRDIVMLNWGYEPDEPRIKRTREIAQSGLKFMVCPGTSSWVSHGTRLENSMINISQFSQQARDHNALGILNTDWGDLGHRQFLGVSLHSFAYGAAHSWNGRAVEDRKFTNTFSRQTFCDISGKITDGLKLVGSSYKYCDGLYHMLVEPLTADKNFYDALPPQSIARRLPNDWWVPGSVEESSGESVRALLEGLSAISFDLPGNKLSDFLSLALKEFEIAANMDRVACTRVILAKNLRAGQPVSAKTYNDIGNELRGMAPEFTSLWTSRNKKSRLCENQLLFDLVIKECDELARGLKPEPVRLAAALYRQNNCI